MDALDRWVVEEMKKRVDSVLGQSISLNMLEDAFFRKENERGYFFDNPHDAEKWMLIYAKELPSVEDLLVFMDGLEYEDLDELKKNPNRFVLWVANDLASEIINFPCDKSIPWNKPSVWTDDLLRKTGFGKFMEK